MKSNKKYGIIVLIIIIAISIFTAGFNLFDKSYQSNTTGNMRVAVTKSGKEGYIAKLYITGVIQDENQTYNQKWLLKTIEGLKKDNMNKGIAVFIDSPGGAVYEADEAYLALQDYKTTGKPVYVYQGSLAASGGYYISCAANKIYANRNTLTGSIGVITSSSFDVTDFLSNLGIKSETIHAGKNKNMFSYNEKVTDEQREIMQTIADECYEQFTGIVAMSRNIPIFEIKKLADGRIYTANQALKNGLIDSIDSWDNMIKNMCNDKFDGKNLKVIDFEYKYTPTVKDYLFGSFIGKGELNALQGKINRHMIRYPAFIYEN